MKSNWSSPTETIVNQVSDSDYPFGIFKLFLYAYYVYRLLKFYVQNRPTRAL